MPLIGISYSPPLSCFIVKSSQSGGDIVFHILMLTVLPEEKMCMVVGGGVVSHCLYFLPSIPAPFFPPLPTFLSSQYAALAGLELTKHCLPLPLKC